MDSLPLTFIYVVLGRRSGDAVQKEDSVCHVPQNRVDRLSFVRAQKLLVYNVHDSAKVSPPLYLIGRRLLLLLQHSDLSLQRCDCQLGLECARDEFSPLGVEPCERVAGLGLSRCERKRSKGSAGYDGLEVKRRKDKPARSFVFG